MLHRLKEWYRRTLSLLLTAAMLFSCMPAYAAGMSVQLEVSDPSTTLPVGTKVTVKVKGSGTAAVSLMIVKPDSRQEFLYGEAHEVTFTKPGLYVLVGYGANGTNEKAAGFARCMSPFHMVTVVGDAPQELEAELTMDVFLNLNWRTLRNATVRRHELPLRLTLSGQDIPEESQVKLELSWGGESQTVLEGAIGKASQWCVDGEPAARALLGELTYGQHSVKATATLTAPDGQTVTSTADFSMGNYSPEMLYVNEFFDDNWVYTGSAMGKRLRKWLDMTYKEDGGERSQSGYLMLEQEIDYRDNRKGAEEYVKWTQKIFSVVSSLGVELIIDEYSDSVARKKFGEAGKDALPYYNMLGSVYNSYAQALLTDMQMLARGSYLVEEIGKSTKLVNIKKSVDAVYKTGELIKHDAEYGKLGEVLGTQNEIVPSNALMYVFSPTNSKSSYYMLGNGANNSGKVHNYTVTKVEEVPLPDGSGTKLNLTWTDEAGVTAHTDASFFSNLAFDGDRVNLDTSMVTNSSFTASDFETAMFRDFTRASGASNQVTYRDSIATYFNKDGVRKININGTEKDFDAETIQELGLMDFLTPEDQTALKHCISQAEGKKFNAWEAGGKVLDLAGIGMDVYQLASGINYHSDLQKAYFNTYKQISNEYIHTLYNWYKELENSDVEDAALIQAAIWALMDDIYASCSESLANAQRRGIVFTQTASEQANLFFDLMEFICDIPSVSASLTKAAASLGKSAVDATKTAVKWVVKTTGSAGKAAAAGTTTAATTGAAATGSTAATTAAKAATQITKFAKAASSVMLAVSIGSLVLDVFVSAHLGYMESIYSIYRSKASLKKTIEDTLDAYGKNPTHQRALDIIESLYLMKELKLKGENVVISKYLAGMYKQFNLDGAKEQLILLNEILNMDHTYQLSGYAKITPVKLVYENYYAGSAREMKDAGYELEGLSILDWETKTAVLGSRIIGVYRTGDAPLTFQGVELTKMPSKFNNLPGRREDAFLFSLKDPVWLKDQDAIKPNWQDDMPTFASERYFVKNGYLYSCNGMELLINGSEWINYLSGENEVNTILKNNNDATGEELHFWQKTEKEESQYQQRMVWTLVTRKYIESLPMFERTGN